MMPKHIPWIKEFPTDELKEIAMLSLTERGAYFSLKLIYHTNPEAFSNVQILHSMCLAFTEAERTAVQTTVERLFKQNNKYPFNERLDRLETLATEGINQKSLAGKKSGESRRAKRTAVRTILESESESESEEEEKKDNTNVLSKEKPAMDVMAVYKALSIQQAPVDQFEDFWEQYGIKEGKDKCKKKYATLLKGGVKHEDIILGVKNYQQECVKQNRERQYIKKPLTFLNGGHWEDDYTNQQQNGGNKNGNNNNGNNNKSIRNIADTLARL